MRTVMTLLLTTMVALSLTACAHRQPVATAGCALVAYPLHVGDTRPLRSTDFEAVLARAMTNPPTQGQPHVSAPRPSVLVLSGGSQHGAFGAGFFAGMPSIPDYKMVTAISTGALQSTFLFLANTPVPADRRYPAYMAVAPGQPRSNPGDLALAYSISQERDLLKVGSGGQVGGVIRGSIGEFGPLRGVLAGLLSHDTLLAVGKAYDPDSQNGRRLLVGVADAVDGNGYAIDMTELASRLIGDKQSFETVQACYIDALIASSSVPLAVPPVTLDVRISPSSAETTQHMYIDGGARFGVFWKSFNQIANIDTVPQITLIVNGNLYGKPWVDKNGQPQTRWSAITLGLRSVDLLENQVYRFSVENVERLGGRRNQVQFAFISDQGLPPPWGDPNDFKWNDTSCADWSKQDDEANVVEFHPHYMKCLLEYGRARGQALAWNTP